MRRIINLALLFAFNLMALAQQQGPQFDQGTVTEGIFESSFFKFRFLVPNGWMSLNDETRIAGNRERYKQQLKRAVDEHGPNVRGSTVQIFPNYDLLVASPTPITSNHISTKPYIWIWAHERFSMFSDAGDHARVMSTFPNTKILRTPEDVVLSEHKFVRADFLFNGHEYLSQFVTAIGDYLVGFEFRADSLDEIQDLAKAMQTIKFDPSNKSEKSVFVARPAQAQRASTLVGDGGRPRKIKYVFLNIHGDDKLGHRLWTYLDLELEDRGFQVVDSERNADAVEDIEVKEVVTPGTVNLALIDIRLPVDERHESGQQCIQEAFLNSFFEKQARSLRDRFPAARTIKLDAESQWPPATKKIYRLKFNSAIEKIGFSLVDDSLADIVLHIELQVPPVMVDWEKLELRKQFVPLDNPAKALRESESITRLIKLRSAMPAGCSYKFDDPDWAGHIGQDLAQEAYKVANALTKWNSGDFSNQK